MPDYYFGCYKTPGHALWLPSLQEIKIQKISNLDGLLQCLSNDQFKARLWFIKDFNLYAIAFWDQTVDRRPGSNSIFYTTEKIEVAELIPYFKNLFPQIFERFPQDIELLHNEFITTTIKEIKERRKNGS